MTNFLRRIRSFGFLMAMAFMLPAVLGGVNVLMAFNGDEIININYDHLISDEDLELEYDQLYDEQLKRIEYQQLLESQISSDSIIQDENGFISYVFDASDNGIISEELSDFIEYVDITNSLLESDELVYVDSYLALTSEVDSYVIQGGKNTITGDYIVVWFVRILVGVKLFADSYYTTIISYSLAVAALGIWANVLSHLLPFVGSLSLASKMVAYAATPTGYAIYYGVTTAESTVHTVTGGATLGIYAVRLLLGTVLFAYAAKYAQCGNSILGGNSRGSVTTISVKNYSFSPSVSCQ